MSIQLMILTRFFAVSGHIKEGWYIFISAMAISLYTVSNIFILGIFTNNTIVGYYSGAEKIIKAVRVLLSLISQVIYSHISKLGSESKDQAFRFIQKPTFLVGRGSFVISFIILVFAGTMVRSLLGSQYLESVIILRILAFIPFIVLLNNVFSFQGLIAFGHLIVILRIVVFGSLVNIFSMIIL